MSSRPRYYPQHLAPGSPTRLLCPSLLRLVITRRRDRDAGKQHRQRRWRRWRRGCRTVARVTRARLRASEVAGHCATLRADGAQLLYQDPAGEAEWALFIVVVVVTAAAQLALHPWLCDCDVLQLLVQAVVVAVLGDAVADVDEGKVQVRKCVFALDFRPVGFIVSVAVRGLGAAWVSDCCEFFGLVSERRESLCRA